MSCSSLFTCISVEDVCWAETNLVWSISLCFSRCSMMPHARSKMDSSTLLIRLEMHQRILPRLELLRFSFDDGLTEMVVVNHQRSMLDRQRNQYVHSGDPVAKALESTVHRRSFDLWKTDPISIDAKHSWTTNLLIDEADTCFVLFRRCWLLIVNLNERWEFSLGVWLWWWWWWS